MTIDFEKIRNDNIEDYGKKTHHLSFLGNLYADRTHFIYELLQNAEDAKATKIHFHLKKSRLEVFHDGRPFDELDVRGICGVGDGTKSDDLTQIGTFGIGFKSVYGYTLNPEIHCGSNHFCIKHYVRPHEIEEKEIESSFSTLFVFPFDRKNEEVNRVTKSEAFSEISVRLKELGIRTLLFLTNLEEISFTIEDASSGTYLRESNHHETHREVKIIGQQDDDEVDEQWLIYSKQLPSPNEVLKTEIAFQIKFLNEKSREVVPLESSRLTVFFPTDQEIHLGFLIQGPFKTTPARDNIPKNDKWNQGLVLEIQNLLSQSLHDIKELGLLTVSFLECLPIRKILPQNEWLLRPLFDVTKNCFLKFELLPTDNGSFVSSKNAKLSRTKDLRSLLSHQQLIELSSNNKPLKWLTGDISENKNKELYEYLGEHLKIEEITPEKFATKLSDSFLETQTDEWFVNFYDFLSGQNALWREGGNKKEGILRRKAFIKCQDDKVRPPFKAGAGQNTEAPVVFLPVKTEVKVPIVKWRIFHDEKAKSFLSKDLRLSKPDICAEVIENVLVKYKNPPVDQFKKLKNGYQHDIEQLAEAFNSLNPPLIEELKSLLKKSSWVLSKNAKTGEEQFQKASRVYLTSFELKEYFRENSDVWFVCEEYNHQRNMLVESGVKDSPRWKHKKPLFYCNKNPSHNVLLSDEHSYHRRGMKGFDPDAEVFGLNNALNSITPEKSAFIWNEVVCKYYRYIRGQVETATRQDFSNAESEECVSTFGQLLDSKQWIKTPKGWKSPSECSVDELPKEFKVDEKVTNALLVKPSNKETQQNTIDDLQKVLDVTSDVASFFMELVKEPSKLTEIQNLLRKPIQKPSFPERTSKNPERRENKVKEQQEASGAKRYEPRDRSIRVSKPPQDPKLYLSELYTNYDNEMICQMCEHEMPFRLMNGEYYFEAVQIDDIHPAEMHQLNLALCPVCAAKYKHLLKKDEDSLGEFLSSLDEIEPSSLTFPFSLENDGRHSIRFVELHLRDVRTILKSPVS